jgi:hypothetical protein
MGHSYECSARGRFCLSTSQSDSFGPSAGPVIEGLEGRTKGSTYFSELVPLVDVLCDEAGVRQFAKALVEDAWRHRVTTIAEGSCAHRAVSQFPEHPEGPPSSE